jgi:hypothetical protein
MKHMNGQTRSAIAMAVVLGVGVALGAVIGNDKSRSMLTERSRGLLNGQRKN